MFVNFFLTSRVEQTRTGVQCAVDWFWAAAQGFFTILRDTIIAVCVGALVLGCIPDSQVRTGWVDGLATLGLAAEARVRSGWVDGLATLGLAAEARVISGWVDGLATLGLAPEARVISGWVDGLATLGLAAEARVISGWVDGLATLGLAAEARVISGWVDGLATLGLAAEVRVISGWVDRVDGGWAVLVSNHPQEGFIEIHVRLGELPSDIEVGDWLFHGVVVPGSRTWMTARVNQLQGQLGLQAVSE